MDADGLVLGAGIHSLAIVTQDKTFVYAPFEAAPRGITMQTLAELIPGVSVRCPSLRIACAVPCCRACPWCCLPQCVRACMHAARAAAPGIDDPSRHISPSFT